MYEEVHNLLGIKNMPWANEKRNDLNKSQQLAKQSRENKLWKIALIKDSWEKNKITFGSQPSDKDKTQERNKL